MGSAIGNWKSGDPSGGEMQGLGEIPLLFGLPPACGFGAIWGLDSLADVPECEAAWSQVEGIRILFARVLVHCWSYR
jgi:hypothetical protein